MFSKANGVIIWYVGAVFLFGIGALSATIILRNKPEMISRLTEVTPRVSTERAAVGNAILYGKLVKIAQGSGGSDEISLRLVEWVLGSDNQEQAAIENGDCTLEMVEQDGCVPNGFYIRNTAKELGLSVAEDANIMLMARSREGNLLSDKQGNLYQQNIPFNDLEDKIKEWNLVDVPFIITTRDGEVIGIVEQYLP